MMQSMCRWLRARAATTLAAMGLAVAAGAATAAPAEPALVLQAVAPGTYFVQGETALGSVANRNFISNAGVVVADGGVLVVDALGSPALAEALLAQIRRLTPLPVRYVVVTHCHADHIYGLQVFRAAGARIVGHVGCREYLASDTARQRLVASRETLAPWVDERTELVSPDLWVGDAASPAELRLAIGRSEVIVRHAGPAHTPEDLLVQVPASGVLFAGDLVFRGRVPFVGQADSRRWIGALDRMLALKPAVLVPGHGPLSREPMADLQLTRDYLAYLREAMGSAARQLEPFDDAYARTDWSRFAHLPLFGPANRMNAYNTYLLMEREAP
ncbi:MAG: MBL fold metallo-hydrolase [Burkholderiales bacterium]|nr:MBL fold metallo-hydrolase [Burkholderiales bacterium]